MKKILMRGQIYFYFAGYCTTCKKMSAYYEVTPANLCMWVEEEENDQKAQLEFSPFD